MKKKNISISLILLIITSIVIPASIIGFADNGDGYEFADGVLTITNDSVMVDYTESEITKAPWYSFKGDINKIVINNGVTKVGSYCFARMDNLTEVEIPESVTTIGTAAFAGNSNLLSLSVSNNVITIGENAFGYNREMKVTEGFVCNCSAGSYAQSYCFKNYIPFETAISESKQAGVSVEEVGGKQTLWSICPAVDTKVTFYSTGGFDTIGFVYDASNYIYSDTNYNTMKNSAIVFNDDGGDNLNFKISTTLEAGKRYYLSTRFSLPSKLGKYNVKFEAECVEHTYKPTGINVLERNIVEVECEYCDKSDYIEFATAVKNQYPTFDMNNDGVVNAKDYAIILKK